jgi:DNA-binding transcriptional regulator YiaG
MNNLGDMFDYVINDCGFDGDGFMNHFIVSGVADVFERGNPKYVAGLSGPELASEVMFRTQRSRLQKRPSEAVDKSPEYWAGWVLAYYQWYTSSRFSDMRKNGLTMTHALSLYPTLHEADLSKFVDVAERQINAAAAAGVSNLKRIRGASGMTQKKLAEESGVALRMIQLYEQRKQDINKAQVIAITRLARALGCEAEDLLEAN